MNDQVAVGDVVQLKSGGPRMTVSLIGEFNGDKFQSAKCDWFVEDRAPWKKETGIFRLTSLIMA